MTKRKSPRHAFRFLIEHDDGSTQTLTAWAKVKRAKRSVALTLTAEDVRRSIKQGGVGNTQTCSMAVCAKRQSEVFPHPVEGYIDWQYSRAYVVSKVSKTTRMPTECVVYNHQDDIAKLNDSRGGQQKLLDELVSRGDRIIHLRAPSRHPKKPGVAKGRTTGERSSRLAAVGAKLRFAMAQLGGFSPN